MSVNENKIILDDMYRTHYDDQEYFFEEIVKRAILRTLTHDTLKAEAMTASKENRLWSQYKNRHAEDIANGITPLFTIVSEYEKKLGG